MSTLPAHRQAINGRTFGQSWSAADMDPFRHYRAPLRPTRAAVRLAGAVLVLGLVLVLAARVAA